MQNVKRDAKLTRRRLATLPLRSIHRARNWSKADVSVVEWPLDSGKLVVVKDLKRSPLWFRVLAGRHFLRREWIALRALRGLESVPEPIARIDADAIAIAHCAGQPATALGDGSLSPAVLQRVEALVSKLHARGVVHCDLHGDNILIDEYGQITLIDWATAGVFGSSVRGAKKWTFDEWAALDDRAVAKLKVRHAPHLISLHERDILLNGGSRAYRTIKSLRRVREKLSGKQDVGRFDVVEKLAAHLQNEDVVKGNSSSKSGSN